MRSWLSPGGTLAALLVGVLVAVGAGWRGLGVLLVFFLSSSLLTPGGGRRRPAQVGANGGVAAVAALLSLAHPYWRLAFVGALAAAAADTWSTEIGGRSRRTPRLLTTLRPVPRGTSGAVTGLGSAGGAAGAAGVAAAAAALGGVPLALVPLLTVAGITGGWADSLLGATLQARYRCPACGVTCETARHGCGGEAVPAGGLAWMTNDAVNLAATLVGAAVALLPVLFGVAGLSSR